MKKNFDTTLHLSFNSFEEKIKDLFKDQTEKIESLQRLVLASFVITFCVVLYLFNTYA